MLDVAASVSPPANVFSSGRGATPCDLPFVVTGFDLVVCQFGAMFFPDKVNGRSAIMTGADRHDLLAAGF